MGLILLRQENFLPCLAQSIPRQGYLRGTGIMPIDGETTIFTISAFVKLASAGVHTRAILYVEHPDTLAGGTIP